MSAIRHKRPDVVDTDTQEGRKLLAKLRERYQIGTEVKLVGEDWTWFVYSAPELIDEDVVVVLAGRGPVKLNSIVGATDGICDEDEDA